MTDQDMKVYYMNVNQLLYPHEIISYLREKYKQTLNDYETLIQQISGDTSNYLQRTNASNPYLNKTIKFTTGELAYVTNQGIVKYIPNQAIFTSLGLSSNLD
jgi:hypothetical protein